MSILRFFADWLRALCHSPQGGLTRAEVAYLESATDLSDFERRQRRIDRLRSRSGRMIFPYS